MPMGVRNGPSIFSRWMAFVLDQLPEDMRPYVDNVQDDIIICHNNIQSLSLITTEVKRLLQKYKAVINEAKSTEINTKIPLLGYNVGSDLSIPPNRISLCQQYIDKLSAAPQVSKRQRARIIGKLNAMNIFADQKIISNLLSIGYRNMSALKDWTDSAPLQKEEVYCFNRVLQLIRLPNKMPPTISVIYSDASKDRLSVTINNKHHSKCYKGEECTSSTEMEMKAIIYGFDLLKQFPPPPGDIIEWHTDSNIAYHILHTNSTNSDRLRPLLREIQHRRQKYKLTFQFVKGSENKADAGSRQTCAKQAKRSALYKEQYRKSVQEFKSRGREKRYVHMCRTGPVPPQVLSVAATPSTHAGTQSPDTREVSLTVSPVENIKEATSTKNAALLDSAN